VAKRTSQTHHDLLTKAEDIEGIVQDKREGKRASKQKAVQRNRRYEKRMLSHMGREGCQGNEDMNI